jgi:hypothetical protein
MAWTQRLLILATFLHAGLSTYALLAIWPAFQLTLYYGDLLALTNVTCVVVFSNAWLFLNPRKSVVLFLRQFRRPSATALVSGALRTKEAKLFRLVTLDDKQFASIGIPLGSVFASLATCILGAMAAAGGAAVVYYFLTTPHLEEALYVLPMITPAVIFSFPGTGIGTVAFFVGLFSLVYVWVVRAVTVNNLRQLARTARRVSRFKSRFRASTLFAPRASIIAASDQIWRDVVMQLVDHADLALIDLSEESDASVWELEYVWRRAPAKLIAVAQNRVEGYLVLGAPEGTGQHLDVMLYADTSRESCVELATRLVNQLRMNARR